ncbi:MAG: arginine N-succinyltransferase [Aeromicrobium sp.]|nr:arginine N-succinyltransferase [Burkholderiales bacterium]
MVVVRPIRTDDLAPLLALVRDTGVGLTTLPNNEGLLRGRIEASIATFAGAAEKADEQWLFVMEDITQTKIVGICAIAGAVGLREPWYSYRVGTVVHASRELGIFTRTPTLFLSNDHTGASELCSLFLAPDYRVGRNGALLSKSRLMFMAQFRDRFAPKVIAELRGVSEADGRSPFWESLGRHFFSMDFAEADYLTGIGKKSFVAELMPKHPLYSSFLSKEAQAVIGETHEMTRPARRLLEQEGFRFEGHVDIFDAGPALELDLVDIDAVQKSSTHTVAAIADAGAASESAAPLMLISNVHMGGFRVGLGRCQVGNDKVVLSADIAKVIGANVGDTVRVVALRPSERA